MERKLIHEMYGRYYNVIQAVASTPILEDPTVDKAFANKSLVQSAYKDKDKINFRGTVIEFIEWLSMVYLVDCLKREIDADAPIIDWFLGIIEAYDRYKIECRNTWKLWAFNMYFGGSFVAAIKDLPYPEISDYEEYIDNLSSEKLKEFMRAGAAFSAFSEILIYEDLYGKRRKDYDDLMSFIRKLVTTKVD